MRKAKSKFFQSLIDKTQNHIYNRKAKFLSIVGKKILLKVVLQANPSYTIGIFLLPKTITIRLNVFKNSSGALMKVQLRSNGWSGANYRYLKRWGLKFRDVNNFKLALLSKQCQYILKDPLSLVSKDFRKNIFKKTLCRPSWGPSYVQRSLVACRDLLLAGLIRRIVSGEKVKIQKDQWINRPLSNRIQSPMFMLYEQATVVELIHEDHPCWKENVLQDLFSTKEANIIKSIPLSSSGREDQQVWHYTKNGLFIVQSAYHLHKSFLARSEGGSSQGLGKQGAWKSIQWLKVPNRVIMFLWRAFKDILPTLSNLKRRKIIDTCLCPICMIHIESVGHALWDCEAGKDV